MAWNFCGIAIGLVTALLAACVPGITFLECIAIYAITAPFSTLLGAVMLTDTVTMPARDDLTAGRG